MPVYQAGARVKFLRKTKVVAVARNRSVKCPLHFPQQHGGHPAEEAGHVQIQGRYLQAAFGKPARAHCFLPETVPAFAGAHKILAIAGTLQRPGEVSEENRVPARCAFESHDHALGFETRHLAPYAYRSPQFNQQVRRALAALPHRSADGLENPGRLLCVGKGLVQIGERTAKFAQAADGAGCQRRLGWFEIDRRLRGVSCSRSGCQHGAHRGNQPPRRRFGPDSGQTVVAGCVLVSIEARDSRGLGASSSPKGCDARPRATQSGGR